jgi:hypothetical protein
MERAVERAGVVRQIAPLASGAALGAASLYVAVVDPATRGVFLPCPFRQATGLWCPGCGLTRGMHALLGGDVPGAVAMNLFTPLAAVLLVAAWWTWTVRELGIGSRPLLTRVPSSWWIVLAGAAVTYGVLRNLPVGRSLAP